ncbi:DUF4189 domain-containing protein [Nocardia amikacinitolerans]|uniref:DUF4189 domain-containing protein n=1 Tax=Nocardia amikacinitolerans TaxID=756689 RepID=UPI0036B61ECB
MTFKSKAAVAVAAVGLAAGSVIGAGTADAAGLYGAIAFSVDEWTYGTSIDAPSREAAIDEAVAWCSLEGAADCVIWVDWANGCSALVYSDDAAATGAGPDRSSALFAAYTSLAEYHPPAMLANVGSADKSGAEISEVLCTANAY